MNVLLAHFRNSPSNIHLTVNTLAGKTVLLTMLSTMCRKCEVLQLKLNELQIFRDKLIFTLPKPTKTYNAKNYKVRKDLQQLVIPRLAEDVALCPMTAMLDYLARVKPVRRDIESVFILFQDKSRPASSQTISRWAKDILKACGLPDFGMGSTRSASASNALLMGIPLDEILGTVGWTTPDTFFKNYMQPFGLNGKKKDTPIKKAHVHPASPSLTRKLTVPAANSLPRWISFNNRQRSTRANNRQLASKRISGEIGRKLVIPAREINSLHPSSADKLRKVNQRLAADNSTSESNVSADKSNMKLKAVSTKVSSKKADKLLHKNLQLPHKNIKSRKPPITGHEPINTSQKYSRGFVSTKKGLSDTSSDLSQHNKNHTYHTQQKAEKTFPGKVMQSLSPLKAFKTVWEQPHRRIKNPSKNTAQNAKCAMFAF